MQELTFKLEAALRRSKTLGRLRTASADKDMQQLLASLEGAKSSLVLVCHVLSEYVLSTCAFSCAPADMLQRSRRVAEHSASMALMNQQAHLLRIAADGGYKPAGSANQTKSSLVPRTPATECLAINANNNLAEDQIRFSHAPCSKSVGIWRSCRGLLDVGTGIRSATAVVCSQDLGCYRDPSVRGLGY